MKFLDLTGLKAFWKKLSYRVINYVDIGDIDFSASEMRGVANNLFPIHYVVMCDGYPSGMMQMFSDNMHHVVTQVFTTHLILSSDGTFDGGHRDDTVYTYYRSYGLATNGLVDIGAWTEWQHMKVQVESLPSMAFGVLPYQGTARGVTALDETAKRPSRIVYDSTNLRFYALSSESGQSKYYKRWKATSEYPPSEAYDISSASGGDVSPRENFIYKPLSGNYISIWNGSSLVNISGT